LAGTISIISVDDHVQEPPTLWTERLPGERRDDQLPHVTIQPDGSERWVIEGTVRLDLPLAETGALAAERFAPTGPGTWRDVPGVVYDPGERLKAMDQEGIACSILYPLVSGVSGEVLGAIKDPALQVACVQAYNDWLLDTWAAASTRFVPQCLVPITSIEEAVTELERAVGKGHRGAILPIDTSQVNSAAPSIYSPQWDPFWARATALGVPVCFHSGSAPLILLDLYPGVDPAVKSAFNAVRASVTSSGVIPKFLFSAIPERFPDLRFVFANSGVGWCSYSLEVSNHEWDRKFRQISPVERKPPPYDMELPGDLFHRQCYITASFESVGMKVRQFVGIDNILWHSEFPRAVSTYPTSRQTLAENLTGVPEAEQEQILSGNAAKLYHLSV
jgi:predicted TIM-barrel fold metal-dependent hydrolase